MPAVAGPDTGRARCAVQPRHVMLDSMKAPTHIDGFGAVLHREALR